MKEKSNIRIHRPDGLHTWGIEYNYLSQHASDADANEFVHAVNVADKRYMAGLLFHQCGANITTHEEGYKGYQFFEYWGPAPAIITKKFAKEIANKIGCDVEDE